MKKNRGFFQKMFGSFSFGASRVPLHSNIYHGSGGYSAIGGTGKWGSQGDRRSPLLGNSTATNLLSGYYERIDELKQYYLLDISKLATGFFYDYVVNFLADNGQQVVTIQTEDGNNDEEKTERINEILTKDLKIFDYIRNHGKEVIFWGDYTSLLCHSRDELGHMKFRFEELFDPISVITKKERTKNGEIKETYLARGEDGKIYEIGGDDAFTLGNINLRLVNDLDEQGSNINSNRNKIIRPSFGRTDDKESNIEHIIKRESYSSGEPLFYSLIIKLKELVIKELLVSLISLRDLSSVQIFLLQFDKSTPLETAKELCSRTTKLANNTNELASFLTSQFDVVSFIENTLSQSAKFVPDYNSTISNKNNMLPLDKLSDKLLDMLQSLDACRNNVLSPLGIPSTILDSTSGSKWAILQQSERANSRVTGFMDGIKTSVMRLVCTIYKTLYHEEITPSHIKLHISEKTSVEFNNQINQCESINGLVQGISNMITTSLQTLDASSPLLDTDAYLSYIQNLVKDVDPNAESLINENTIKAYSAFAKMKLRAQAEQLGVQPEEIDQLLSADQDQEQEKL